MNNKFNVLIAGLLLGINLAIFTLVHAAPKRLAPDNVKSAQEQVTSKMRDRMIRALIDRDFNYENRLRVLEGKQPVSKNTYVTAFISEYASQSQ